MQPVDFTTINAICSDLRAKWLPARLEQVHQRDRTQVALALRTLDRRGWLRLCWHPQAAHLCAAPPPPRDPDTFTFSDQLRHQLKGLALVAIEPIAPWERALDFQFARRPGDPVRGHLYVEIMGKYSNVILANADNLIVTAAHQVTSQQSSVRPILTGQPYEPPPALTDAIPRRDEPQSRWQERIALVPNSLRRNILKTYRGLSSALVRSLCHRAQLDSEISTDRLSEDDWNRLFAAWQEWLARLEKEDWSPGWTETGYTVLGWDAVEPVEDIQKLIDRYYRDGLNQQVFKQLRHQLTQKVSSAIAKLQTKRQTFLDKLQQSDDADVYRQRADLLMAHLHEWQPGMTQMSLTDFETGEPVTLSLDPEKNAVSNAQALYKRHQKLRRAKNAVRPLLRDTEAEIDYLQQVDAALSQLDRYGEPGDLAALEDIRDELVEEGYLSLPQHRKRNDNGEDNFYHFQTPSGFELLIGRNNRQNDLLSFRMANDYDLWFHTQEIPGSHVLLRLDPGAVPDAKDLQFAANLAAYYSRARDSDAAPVVYTHPKHVYKPKGAKPGMAIYKHETVIWGKPGTVRP